MLAHIRVKVHQEFMYEMHVAKVVDILTWKRFIEMFWIWFVNVPINANSPGTNEIRQHTE